MNIILLLGNKSTYKEPLKNESALADNTDEGGG
jgi:hypothetical protein